MIFGKGIKSNAWSLDLAFKIVSNNDKDHVMLGCPKNNEDLVIEILALRKECCKK